MVKLKWYEWQVEPAPVSRAKCTTLAAAKRCARKTPGFEKIWAFIWLVISGAYVKTYVKRPGYVLFHKL